MGESSVRVGEREVVDFGRKLEREMSGRRLRSLLRVAFAAQTNRDCPPGLAHWHIGRRK